MHKTGNGAAGRHCGDGKVCGGMRRERVVNEGVDGVSMDCGMAEWRNDCGEGNLNYPKQLVGPEELYFRQRIIQPCSIYLAAVSYKLDNTSNPELSFIGRP